MKTDDNGRCKLVALFGEMEWGPKARGWSQATSRLNADPWRLITSEATVCGKKLPQDEDYGEDAPDVNPCAVLEL